MNKKMRDWLIIVVIFLIAWFCPVPEGLTWGSWHIFSVFIATIIGFILQPIPMGAMAFLGIAVAGMTKVLSAKVILGGFGSTTLWLIICAFFFAKGFEKTGLGRRIAFVVIRAFGKKSLSLAYSIGLASLILGPAIPSNTARAGGVLFPVIKSLSEAYDSQPGPTAKRLGSFLMSVTFQIDAVVSAMFLTSMAANPLIADFAQKTLGITISWGGWIEATIVPGLCALIVVVLATYLINRPEIKATPKAPELARQELEAMGKMSRHEWIMLFVFVLALVLWITSGITKFDNTIVAILGIAILLVTGVLEWTDISGHKQAWTTFVWTGFIMLLSAQLNSSGFIKWFAHGIMTHMAGLPWIVSAFLAMAIYLYSHYGFASMTAHVSAMYVGLISVAAAAGAPPFVAAFSVAMAASLCGVLTHYGTGPAPVYFGAGYVSQGKWWQIGFVMSVLNICIFYFVGLAWWKVLGLW